MPLHEGKKPTSQMQGYRAILLEPTVARAFSRTCRPFLVQGATHAAQPLQYGGRKGLAIESLHLLTRLWQINARRRAQSLALVFIDIQSAFYAVTKEMIAGFDGTEDTLVAVFQRLNLPSTAFEEFKAHVGTGNEVFEHTRSSLLAGSAGANLRHTWFAVENGNALQAPATGSRPGDPNADLLYSFIMSKILRCIRSRAEDAGIALEEDTPYGPVVNHAAWVDDAVFAIFSSAESLISKTATLLSIIIDVATEHGMQLSFGPGKTSVLFEFHGKRAQSMRQKLDKEFRGFLPVCSEHWGCKRVPITNHYKYLGGFLVRGGSKLQEIRVRSACAHSNMRPLKKVLTNDDMSMEHKRTLVKSFGLSRLVLHSGTWCNLTQGEYQAWHAAVYKLYQVVQPRNVDGTVKHSEMYQLAEDIQSPMPMELLYINRLRLLFHLFRTADAYLIAAVLWNFQHAGEASWLYGTMKSVKWLQSQLGREVIPDELHELQNPQTWKDFQPAHNDLKKTLKKAEKAHLLRVKGFCSFLHHRAKQHELLLAMNWQAPAISQCISVEHSCDVCDKKFATQAALATHQQRKHGQRVAMRFFAIDGVCRACHRNYHTRSRLIQHLHHGASQCWVRHLRAYHPMSAEQMQDLDEKDIQLGIASHQHGFVRMEFDKIWNVCENADLTSTLHKKDFPDVACGLPQMMNWSSGDILVYCRLDVEVESEQ